MSKIKCKFYIMASRELLEYAGVSKEVIDEIFLKRRILRNGRIS